MNFNIIDDADKSRIYNCNNQNYFLINGATKYLNENIIGKRKQNKTNLSNDEEQIENIINKNNNYFTDNKARFIINNSKRNRYNFILNKYLTKYDVSKEIPSMTIDSNTKFLDNSSINLTVLECILIV